MKKNILKELNGTYSISRLNGLSISKNNDSDVKKIILDDSIEEGVEYTFDKKGGIITFSTDVNAVYSNSSLINKLKLFLKTMNNRFFYSSKIQNVMKKHDDVYAFTIGRFLKGQYKSKDGRIFNENSLSVEIVGISSKTLISISENICKEFEQECVLVKDYNDNQIYLVNSK
jgi:hypothetical protein